MDVQDLEAIRRRGYFHETIGDIQKYSYRDFSTMMMESGEGDLSQSGAVLERSGSQVLAATKANRRGSIGQHVSRQYASAEKLVEEDHRYRDPEDTYSGFMKWDTRAAAVAITDTMKKRRSSVSNHMTRSTGSISDTHSANNDPPFSPASFNYQRGNYDEQEQQQQQQQQPLSVNTQWEGDQGQGNDQSISQNTSNFVPFTASDGSSQGAPKGPSYISSLFGKLGMDQPDVPTAADRAPAETSEAEGGGGYTSDPGYSAKHNGTSRYGQLNPAASSSTATTSADTYTGADVGAASTDADIGAQTGAEQQQIDAYLAWLEAQETEGGAPAAAAGNQNQNQNQSMDAIQDRVVDAVRTGFVPNDLHLQQGLDDVKEEKWETKLRQAQERGEDE